ncbi:MAG: hypothetical protein R3195_13680 [Gemmatimonadota bacterium]|nr:hypothetical protein [Gemmatimonadota bacterium]
MREAGVAALPSPVEFPDAGTARPIEQIAWGKMTTVYRAELDGRTVALKIYRRRYIDRHAARHPTNIAEFEFNRNAAFRSAPGLARHAPRPIACVHGPSVTAFAQELVEGDLYLDVSVRRGGPIEPVFDQIRRIVDIAHAHGLFDIDLHALNVLVVEDGGEEIPVFFDFNAIPFYQDPRNPFEALALRLGVIDERTRDRKKLRTFHDFEKFLKRRARVLARRTA